MSSVPTCPICGSRLKVNTTPNPLRNIVKVYVRCGRCGFEKTYERPPETTLEDWLKGALQKEKSGGVPTA